MKCNVCSRTSLHLSPIPLPRPQIGLPLVLATDESSMDGVMRGGRLVDLAVLGMVVDAAGQRNSRNRKRTYCGSTLLAWRLHRVCATLGQFDPCTMISRAVRHLIRPTFAAKMSERLDVPQGIARSPAPFVDIGFPKFSFSWAARSASSIGFFCSTALASEFPWAAAACSQYAARAWFV